MKFFLASVFLSIFSLVAVAQDEVKVLETGWYFISDSVSGHKMYHSEWRRNLFVDPNPIVTKDNIREFHVKKVTWPNVNVKHRLTMWLDESGTKSWATATREARTKTDSQYANLVFVVDNSVVCALYAVGEIPNGATSIWSENLSKKDLKKLVKKIKE